MLATVNFVLVLVTVIGGRITPSFMATALRVRGDAAAVVQAARLAQWQGHLTLGEPLLWVLHLAYRCMPVGLLLKGVALLGVVGWAGGWLHVLTVGAIALMILGVMTRVSLGHTGRALVLPRGVATAYVLLAGAAAVRAIGPAQTVVAYGVTEAIAAALWTLAFALYLWRYAAILWQPRPDGRSG